MLTAANNTTQRKLKIALSFAMCRNSAVLVVDILTTNNKVSSLLIGQS